jgi:hypothetical protein
MERVVPREVTAEEIRRFQEDGWVKLDQLITEAEAAELYARVIEKMGTQGTTTAHPLGGDGDGSHVQPYFHYFAPLSIDVVTGEVADEVFHGFSHSPELGRLGMSLSGEPIRFWIDEALLKMPATSATGSAATEWHSEASAITGTLANSPFDPAHGQLQVWIALKPVTPEVGALRFVAPRDIDAEVQEIVATNDLPTSYAKLEEKGVISAPLHLRAGDATVHGSATLHSAPQNVSETPRWVYLISVIPATMRFSGKVFWPCDGVEGVVVGEPFPEHRFPTLSQP